MSDYKDRIIGGDGTARYNIKSPDGTTMAENVELVLASQVEQEGDRFGAKEANLLLEKVNGEPRLKVLKNDGDEIRGLLKVTAGHPSSGTNTPSLGGDEGWGVLIRTSEGANGAQLGFWKNLIQARHNNAATSLRLNMLGGDVYIGPGSDGNATSNLHVKGDVLPVGGRGLGTRSVPWASVYAEKMEITSKGLVVNGEMDVYDSQGGHALWTGLEQVTINRRLRVYGDGVFTLGNILCSYDIKTEGGNISTPNKVIAGSVHGKSIRITSMDIAEGSKEGYAIGSRTNPTSENNTWIHSMHMVIANGTSVPNSYLEIATGAAIYGITANISDKRLKKDIDDTRISATEVINGIRHREFGWIAHDGHTEIGYVAQELKEVVPGAVIKVRQSESEDDYLYQINDPALIPYITKMLQEIEARVKKIEEGIGG